MLTFPLARELKMTVGQLLGQISSYKLTEWQSVLLIESGGYKEQIEIKDDGKDDGKAELDKWRERFGSRLIKKAE